MRSLKNPDHRLPIRSDFPDAINLKVEYKDSVLKTLHSELKKINTPADDVHITVAVPHKVPEKGQGISWPIYYALYFVQGMAPLTPGVQWQITNGLVETVQLNRSGGWHEKRHTRNQQFAYYPELEDKPVPFFKSDTNKTNLFVIFDDVVDCGSTLADLASYITYNGGHVLFAAAQNVLRPRIALRRDGEDCPIEKLGHDFAAAASTCNWSVTPKGAIDMLNASLRAHGHSLDGLTHAEYTMYHSCVTQDSPYRFFEFAKRMGLNPPGLNTHPF